MMITGNKRVVQSSMLIVLLGVSAGCQRSPEVSVSTPAVTPPPAYHLGASDSPHSTQTEGRALKVTVKLSPSLAKQASPEDVVFIFARATSGPRMPLAIVRTRVKNLPTTVVLDDSQAMMPQMPLSVAREVVVIARVSKSGMAEVQAGDLEGQSKPLPSGTKTVTVSIDKVLAGK